MPAAFESRMRHILSPRTAVNLWDPWTLACEDESVLVEKEDGSRVKVPYQALRAADRAFVDAWRNGHSAGDSNPR